MNQYVAKSASHINEDLLRKCLVELFPGERILVNTLKEHDLKYANTGKYMEFDIWFPKFKLCFEFQDSYHYVNTWYKTITLDEVKQKDDNKQSMLRQKAISLLVIPCWWDGTTASLASTIHHHLPDLLCDNDAHLIPLNPTDKYFMTPDTQNVRELMLASFADSTFCPVPFDWWMGEKYDGVRCYWDTSEQVMLTRTGREINLLPIIKEGMPKTEVDCELWHGRGQYSDTFELIAKNTPSFWESLRVMAFDVLPNDRGNTRFEQRYSDLLASINSDHAFFIPAFRMLCSGDVQLRRIADDIMQKGGEGVILRRIGSLYEFGRSPSLLKLKTGMGDKEAVVVDVKDDGALDLKLPNGKTFTVPRKDVHIPRASTGDIVSFSYDENVRHDIPINPSVFRIRTDITWEDVIRNSVSDDRQYTREAFQTKPIHYWTPGNLRKHLEQIAHTLQLDPLVASTWHTITRSTLVDFEGGSTIRTMLKGPFHKCIQSLFPEIDFKFGVTLSEPHDPLSRRAFFVNYAKKKGFDPLVANNWYKQVKEHILAEQGGSEVLGYYKRSLKHALITLFPDIELDESKFPTLESWTDVRRRRELMIQFARENNFDPLIAENWLAVHGKTFLKYPSASSVVKYYYGSSLVRAAEALFPEVQFPHIEKITWKGKDDRRNFFITYAKKRKFDPLIPENWYQQTLNQIFSEKGGSGVMRHYKKRFQNCIA